MYGQWTPELDAKLRHLLVDQGLSARAAGQELGRTAGACNLRAKKLGISRLNRQDWSEAETDRLRGLFETTPLSTRALAKQLHRTEHSVRWKLEQLGLSRGRDIWTEAQIAILRRMHSENASYEAIAQATGRTPGSVAGKARALGIGQCLRRPWTKTDLDGLRQAIVAGESAECFAARTERSVGAVIRKAYELGTAFLAQGRSRPWTDAEDTALRATFGPNSSIDTAERLALAARCLNRPERGVRLRAIKLGLIKPREPRHLDHAAKEQILALATGDVSITEASRLLNRDVRTLKAVAQEAGVAFAKKSRKMTRDAAQPSRPDARRPARKQKAKSAETAQLVQPLQTRNRTKGDPLHQDATIRGPREGARRSLPAGRRAVPPRAVVQMASRVSSEEAFQPTRAPSGLSHVSVENCASVMEANRTSRPNLVSGFFARPVKPASGLRGREAALAVSAEMAHAVERFLAERGATREKLDPAEVVVRRLRARGYAVLQRGDGYLVDGRVELATFSDLVDFARSRAIETPELAVAAE
jgi:hypothetical protein